MIFILPASHSVRVEETQTASSDEGRSKNCADLFVYTFLSFFFVSISVFVFSFSSSSSALSILNSVDDYTTGNCLRSLFAASLTSLTEVNIALAREVGDVLQELQSMCEMLSEQPSARGPEVESDVGSEGKLTVVLASFL